MEVWLYAPIAFGVLVLIWWVATWNRFVRLRNLVLESWAGIDVALKRRYDLIPNLVEAVKGYAAYEGELLERVTMARENALRSIGAIKEQARDESELTRSLRAMFARVEAYPELKASAHFMQLQRELASTEDRIAAARRFYNANVRELNLMLQEFPSSIVGKSIAVATAEYFEAEAASRVPVAVNVE